MLELIDQIPTHVFEILGTCAGGSACLVLLVQTVSEIRTPRRSSLSLFFLFGWFLIFLLWFLYGVRFRTVALWSTNAVGMALQAALIAVVLFKRRTFND